MKDPRHPTNETQINDYSKNAVMDQNNKGAKFGLLGTSKRKYY